MDERTIARTLTWREDNLEAYRGQVARRGALKNKFQKNAITLEAFIEFLSRNELIGGEARQELGDWIRRLKRKGETAAETVDAIHSGLERMGQ
jgi:hypothetical protein